ncbi:XRE family transcriptional regulator [Ensifer sp. MPMI2T]|nr:XRE family transcriptional regulator [Ensifer sp. MPMI2T]
MTALNQAIKTRSRAPQSNTRSPSKRELEISATVGQNIRTLRAMTGMSQMTLAEKLGITFQQVQKYEKGTNRVSAPKLVLMAEIFKTPISTFFSNIELLPSKDGGVTLPTFGKDGMRAARLFEVLPPKIQGAALRVLQSLSEGNGE